MNAHLEEILALPVRERITLAEDIWDNIAAVSEAVKLTEAQVDEIAQRLEDTGQIRTNVAPSEEVKERLFLYSRYTVLLTPKFP